MGGKLAFAFLLFLFGGVALAIGQGPWETDIMRVILVSMFVVTVIRYNWPKYIPVRVYAVTESVLWIALLASGVYCKNVNTIAIGIGLAILVGFVFYLNYLDRKDKETVSQGESKPS